MSDLSTAQIEQQIQNERHALERTIEKLQAELKPDVLMDHATKYLESYGRAAARSLGQTVKEKPIAAAVASISTVWLLAGRKGDSSSRVDYRKGGGAIQMKDQTESFDERVARADARMRRDAAPTPIVAQDAIHSSEGESDMSDLLEENWTSVKDQARKIKSRAYRSAAELRDRIHEGTADLPEAARERVYRARIAAIDAQEEIERRARKLAKQTRRTSEEHPLLLGALTFAAGAALAASLPRTSTENNLVGAQRDRLFDEADRVFRQEAVKLKSAAEAAVAEGKTALKETLSGDGPKVSVEQAVERVSRAAKSAAKSHKQGTSS